MCPACYINGLLFLIFGAAGASIANNPWVIAISVVLTIAGFWWMWRAYKKNKGKGGFIKNLKKHTNLCVNFCGRIYYCFICYTRLL